MRIPGVRTLARSGRWLRSRWAPGALILLYHRIAEPRDQPGEDPFDLCVSPRRFAEHLEALRRLGRPSPLGALSDRPEAGDRPGSTVAVTFDDGYLDNLQAAAPLLEKLEVPATFFLVTGSPGSTFWWDELVAALFRPRRLPRILELTVDGRRRSWRVSGSSAAARRRLLFELHPILAPRGPRSRRLLLEQITAWADPGEGVGEGPRALTADEVEMLAASPMAEIGSHGVTHSPLSRLDGAGQRREIEASKSSLEQLVRRPVTSFAYPYGQPGDMDERSRTLLREAGYARACTSVLDVARPRRDPFRLPRYWVGDWTGAGFTRRLRRWLGD